MRINITGHLVGYYDWMDWDNYVNYIFEDEKKIITVVVTMTHQVKKNVIRYAQTILAK